MSSPNNFFLPHQFDIPKERCTTFFTLSSLTPLSRLQYNKYYHLPYLYVLLKITSFIHQPSTVNHTYVLIHIRKNYWLNSVYITRMHTHMHNTHTHTHTHTHIIHARIYTQHILLLSQSQDPMLLTCHLQQ